MKDYTYKVSFGNLSVLFQNRDTALDFYMKNIDEQEKRVFFELVREDGEIVRIASCKK